MNTLTAFLTWLMSMVGINTCDLLSEGPFVEANCPEEIAQPVETQVEPDENELLSFISNGL